MSSPHDSRESEAARIIEAVAAQRDLVARQLHDDAVQSVSVAALRVELVRAAVGPGVEEVDELRDVLRTATLQIRAVMDGLRRPVVANGELARSLRQRLASGPGTMTVVDDLLRDPPEPVGLALHWAAEECVRALRRGNADGAISVTLRSPVGVFGFDLAAAGDADAATSTDVPEGATQLIALLGGAITAEPSTPGIARFSVRVPWAG